MNVTSAISEKLLIHFCTPAPQLFHLDGRQLLFHEVLHCDSFLLHNLHSHKNICLLLRFCPSANTPTAYPHHNNSKCLYPIFYHYSTLLHICHHHNNNRSLSLFSWRLSTSLHIYHQGSGIALYFGLGNVNSREGTLFLCLSDVQT